MTVRVSNPDNPLQPVYGEVETAFVALNGFSDRTIAFQSASNSAPTSILISSVVIDSDDDPVGMVIAILSGVDPDGDALDYQLVSNPGGHFRIDGNALLIDRAFTDQYAAVTIIVRASDPHGASIDHTFIIQADPDVIRLPAENSSGPVELPLEEWLWTIEDTRIVTGGPWNPSDLVSLPVEEFPGMIEGTATTPTNVTSLTRNGGKKADVLKGGAGDDLLNGSLGSDKLTGGGGQDTFAFTTKLGRTNVDRILDFQHADDTINLSKAVFSKLQKGILSKDAFWVGAKAHDMTDRIICNEKTGALSYDADGSGTKYTAVKFAQLKAGTLLEAEDFFIM